MLPKYFICVNYEENNRKFVVIYKIKDIINDLTKYDFIVKKSKSVVSLNNCINIQRKGGDGGKKSSNQLQFKIIISNITTDFLFKHHF